MTEEHRRRLSQLVDGELDSDAATRLLGDMGTDPALKAAWERYQLIGHALRRESVEVPYRGIADQVRERLANEPTLLLPQRSKRSRKQTYQRAAGLAMAASVALAAFLGAPILFQEVGSEVSSEPPRLVERESIPIRRLQREHPSLASKLDLYLVTHQATAPATGAKGMLPYATLVGYEVGR